ncbi:hypothetical protein SAMN02745127_01581 [Oceanospirillum multiglobuliferum]|uniref:Uncharacterized protein n=1 Tax=Oceanospirillum multiglobuliferum TaxID=64969 RepID=A0A1T4PQZ3_9GAMM|nr:hypothetical protein [Oceanospirillum multiglobuliferum]OPX55361.1 hypothetical protein BTE48_09350 [Oceanospirillum multiglobuliferum]SJZ94002.1 hypothetical protein SAMN02745127_01581 [Oceanospirillum multiglobuliferum]
MKYVLIFIAVMSSVAFAETLITDSFTIQIERDCEEGEVTCDMMRFIYSPTDIEKKQIAIGRTVHTTCADGITPCAFQGYEFMTDGAKYFIYNSGILEITDIKNKPLLVEQGRWQY